MRIVTSAEMKRIDAWAQRTIGIPSTVLMENAGRGCADILSRYRCLPDERVLIICGPGNNGGDGFVIARHLENRGSCVRALVTVDPRALTGDGLLNYRIARRAGIDIIANADALILSRQIRSFRPTCIIDAIFGTGFHGAPSSRYQQIFDRINGADAFVLSVDIPSGLNGDTGQCEGSCVTADVTAAMCLTKRGHWLYPGRDLSGDLHVVDIGLPKDKVQEGFPRVTGDELVRLLLPSRPSDGHKGTFGSALVVAGARGYSGAAVLTARASFRVGAGYVYLAVPRSIANIVERRALEAVKVSLPETAAGSISRPAIKILSPFLKRSNAVVIGPGLTTSEETARFLADVLPLIKVPLVIDADGLNIMARRPSLFKRIQVPFIITPHPGELSRLIRRPPAEINRRRIDIAAAYSRRIGGVVVLKGAPTVVASPHGEIYVNPTGNSGLATAGSGDVLVGMIAGFLAQRASTLDAAVSGVYLHGLSADLAMAASNEYSLTAGDLIGYIPSAINQVRRRQLPEPGLIAKSR